FNTDTGQYHCKKCNEKGNTKTLQKYFNDIPETKEKSRNIRTVTPALVEKYHHDLPDRIKEYLLSRGISEKVINESKIGYIFQYGTYWIAIPIKDIDGNHSFFKLRQDPQYGNQKMTWPSGGENNVEAQIYDWNTLLMANGPVVITEGEMDALLMKSRGIRAISGTHGAGTAKDTWFQYFKPDIEYYICYDNDLAGRNGSLSLANKLLKAGITKIKIITLPPEVEDKGDLGDYLVRLKLPVDKLFSKYAEVFPKKIDTSHFKEVKIDEVVKILERTIKKDDDNKIATFLSMLTTYTDDSQMNLFFNAPSSTGKSHIPLSVAELFPKEDIITLAYCSPTAFFHDQGLYNKEKNEIVVDLSKKILIFTDMPDSTLVARLRPLLSHDEKESRLKITDKAQKGGNKTKNIVLLGFPSVYFCSAEMRIDEQESTRFLMLSPSIEHDKVYQGIRQSILKASNNKKFTDDIKSDEERNLLKERIIGIRQENIKDINIENIEYIEELFFKDCQSIKPRQQRDVKKIISLIKGFTLLNLWFRKRENDYLYASDEDIKNAFVLWNRLSYGQDYGLAPYIYDIYNKVIMVLWKEPGTEKLSRLSGDDKRTFITR
ncbi:MAG TPA: toprim domain-containing protein, partial [Candidatus Absconditabacterales bacterium]|nr:toprim domain-containing protein [Candidatus Absconditabacterales bacterium]